MEQRYLVCLTTAQRAELERRDAGSLTRRQRKRVHVLLRADAGENDADIADALGTHVNTVARIRRRFAASGLDARAERPRSGVPAKLDGKAEALLIALACSPAPDGYARWSARLRANRLVELEVVESISDDTVRRVLKKATSSRGRRRAGACPRG